MREALATMAEAEADPGAGATAAQRRLARARRPGAGGRETVQGGERGALVAVAEATSRVTARVVRVFGVD